MPSSKPSGKPGKSPNANKPASGAKAGCANKTAAKPVSTIEKYDMVEIIEIEKQGKVEKKVSGRTDKDGSDLKQYINLDRVIDGKKYHQYGRKILFKAKIKQTSGKTQLKGITVKFSYKIEHGPNKSEAKVWLTNKTLVGNEKEGFGSASKTITSTTDKLGWTGPVSFDLSMYGGDKFEIYAELDPNRPEAKSAKKVKTAAKYIVWRKFWYQLTYPKSFAYTEPSKAQEAYKEVFVEMKESKKFEFDKNHITSDDIKARTFYKEYMLKKTNSQRIVAAVGYDNILYFKQDTIFKENDPKKHPLKANVIACEYQCDSDSDKKTQSHLIKLTQRSQSVQIPSAKKGGPIICKPAMLPGGKLIVKGEWSRSNSPWRKRGNVTDGAIEIDSNRPSTRHIKIDLSGGATNSPPVPTARNPIWVKLELRTASSFLGLTSGKHTVCVYKPGTTAGKQASKEDFNDTAAHELGHMWKQASELTNKPISLKAHPLQYLKHGGSGSHCKHGVANYKTSNTTTSNNVEPETKISVAQDRPKFTHQVTSSANFINGYPVKVAGTDRVIRSIVNATKIKFTSAFTANVNDVVKQVVKWNDKTKKLPVPQNGDCIMFHQYSSSCSHKFCNKCKPYLQLKDMSSL